MKQEKNVKFINQIFGAAEYEMLLYYNSSFEFDVQRPVTTCRAFFIQQQQPPLNSRYLYPFLIFMFLLIFALGVGCFLILQISIKLDLHRSHRVVPGRLPAVWYPYPYGSGCTVSVTQKIIRPLSTSKHDTSKRAISLFTKRCVQNLMLFIPIPSNKKYQKQYYFNRSARLVA